MTHINSFRQSRIASDFLMKTSMCDIQINTSRAQAWMVEVGTTKIVILCEIAEILLDSLCKKSVDFSNL